jgi:hypothetical protein
MTPPAIAPTFGPEPDDFVELELIVDGEVDDATQIVFWQASQVGGTREQISLSAQLHNPKSVLLLQDTLETTFWNRDLHWAGWSLVLRTPRNASSKYTGKVLVIGHIQRCR